MFQGGLGNQLFQYSYYMYLKKKFPNNKIYGSYFSRWLNTHNGLEISKWFDVTMPPSTFYSNCIFLLLFVLTRFCYFLKIKPFFVNFKYERDDKAFFQEGFWLDKEFLDFNTIPSYKNELVIDDYNKRLIERINNTESVSIHIRRGDYLKPKNEIIYGNICTRNYYKCCIDIIKKQFKTPVFFVFSNDMEYAKSLFSITENCVYVDGNTGDKSFFDMYLMAHCKGMILANSTFSCWAAYLNKNANFVLSPSRWTNVKPYPKVNRNNWIIIENERN